MKLPRRPNTSAEGPDFGRQVFQFASDTFDFLRAMLTRVESLVVRVETLEGAEDAGIVASDTAAEGEFLVATSATEAEWQTFSPRNELIQSAPSSFTFTANAATLDVSTRNDWACTNTLTADSTITLTNGIDGCQGVLFVQQDGTGGWGLTFTVSGRTILREGGASDSDPQATASSLTGYAYLYTTINSTAYVIIERFPLT